LRSLFSSDALREEQTVSLIEQAAKRLEELRRAGALTEKDSSADPHGKSETGHDRVPTPEAVIRALDARAHEPGAAPPPAPAVAEWKAQSAGVPPTVARPVQPPVEIDLDRLKALGFVTPDAPKSQIADEFRVIKRPILRNARGKTGARIRNGTLVMVTSALPGEGKTFTALNLAMSVAMEIDNTVLLVDGDVAHPSIPDLLGVPPSPGLLDLLTKTDIDVSDALVKTNIDKLTILPAGSRHRRATELLASEQMASLLAELASRYPDRIVIFDSPPLLATTESRVLATNMGQIVMVVSSDATTQHAVKHALAAIDSCEIVMMVLNKARQSEVGTYYGYYSDDDAR
jgi:receptor protein-tyrosine kinase